MILKTNLMIVTFQLFLNFFYGGENEKFHVNCKMLGLNRDNSELIDFICLEKGEEMM